MVTKLEDMTTNEKWRQLSLYSACDIADALLKLNVPGAGFLVDIAPIPHPTTPVPRHELTKVLASASTFLFVPKSSPSFPNPSPKPENIPDSNLEDGSPYADLAVPNTIVLISQPSGQSCAVMGGIMAARMMYLGAQSIIVDGRVRDLAALGELGIPVWSKGTSVIGAGAEAKFYAKQVKIKIGEVEIEPGDVVMVDPAEKGVVVVPRGRLDEVLGILPGAVEADGKVVADVAGGGSVKEAFAKHRS